MDNDFIFPGGFSTNLLWENKNKNNFFPAQAIEDSVFAGFSWFVIEFIGFAGDVPPLYNRKPQFAIAKKGDGTLFGGINAFSFREYRISDSGIQFRDAGYITPYGGDSVITTNAIMIPKAVYGIN